MNIDTQAAVLKAAGTKWNFLPSNQVWLAVIA
jgi:hypothetical protein